MHSNFVKRGVEMRGGGGDECARVQRFVFVHEDIDGEPCEFYCLKEQAI